MAEQQSLIIWRKKTFCYNFFPSKAEEEVNNAPWVVTVELIETGPAVIINQSWRLKKKITHKELAQGNLVISSFDTFEYILPHWKLDKAKSLVNGYVVPVRVWDITEKNDLKKYEDETVNFRKLNDGYSLMIVGLFNDRRLGIGDEIRLY